MIKKFAAVRKFVKVAIGAIAAKKLQPCTWLSVGLVQIVSIYGLSAQCCWKGGN